jgi:integrase
VLPAFSVANELDRARTSAKLTDKYVASVSAPPGKRLDLFDQQINGLILRVTDQGRKTWVVRYRTENGRQPRYTLGTYPALKLADARDEAIKLLAQTKIGVDPATERRKVKQKVQSQPIRTFGELADAYLTACERGEWKPKNKQKRKRTLDGERAVLRRYVTRILGDVRLEDISRSTVKKLLRDMVAKGINAQTNQTQAFIRQAFAYGIAEFEGDLITYNPATGFSTVGKINRRTRVLNDTELKVLWNATVHPTMLEPSIVDGKMQRVTLSRPMAIALQLCILLLTRESEVSGMRVAELDFENAIWLIPAERMKGGWPHLVPLPPEALKLIKEAMAWRKDEKSPCVFPSPRDVRKPVRGDSIYHAMVKLVAATAMNKATPHDLRRTGSTVMTSERLGVMPFIRSKVLGHRGDMGGGAAVSMLHYDMNEYVAEKRRALNDWSNLVLRIVNTAGSDDRKFIIQSGCRIDQAIIERANARA